MIRSIIRKFCTFLSFPNNLLKENKNKKKLELQIFLKEKAKNIINNNSNKLKTHSVFSNNILELIINFKLDNFLRYSFIQKMFFVNNRFYLIFFLLKILKKKKFVKLLKEENIGNPLPFFFYKSTSGNKIRHLYHLLSYTRYKSLKADIFIEIGGGYGCMAHLINKYSSPKKYIIFDTPEVVLLQYYYLKNLNYDVGFDNENFKIILVSNLNKLNILIKRFKNNKKFLISNWALSEMPISLRKKLSSLFFVSENFLMSFQNKFEEIDNFKFFNYIKNRLIGTKIFPIREMNFLNSNKHYYFFK
jgi:hypothetical protein